MPATYMLRKHLRSQEIAARPENQRRRAVEIEAAKRGAEDRKVKYPTITPENFVTADQYQKSRIEYWRDKLAE